MELSSNGLARQEATLTDQELAGLVKGSAGEHNLLGTIFEESAMALLQKAKQEAHETGCQALIMKVSQDATAWVDSSYEAKSDDECDVAFLT